MAEPPTAKQHLIFTLASCYLFSLEAEIITIKPADDMNLQIKHVHEITEWNCKVTS